MLNLQIIFVTIKNFSISMADSLKRGGDDFTYGFNVFCCIHMLFGRAGRRHNNDPLSREMRVAKRTNKQSTQGMDLPHIIELNFMVQSFCSMEVMCISSMSFFSCV